MVSEGLLVRAAERSPATVVRSDPVESMLTARLVEDEVLRELGIEVRTTAMDSAVAVSGHGLLVSWDPPHVGAKVAIQQLTLRVQQAGGADDRTEEIAHVVLQRAVAVLTERATRRDLPVVQVTSQPVGPHQCVLNVLYRLSAEAA